MSHCGSEVISDNISLCLTCSRCDAVYSSAQLHRLGSSALERKKLYISLPRKQAKVDHKSAQYVNGG